MQGDIAAARRLTQQAYEVASEDMVERAFYMMRLAALEHLESGNPPVTSAYENLLVAHPMAMGIRCVLASGYATLGMREMALLHFDFVADHDFERLPDDINWLGSMAMLADAAVHLEDRERSERVFAMLEPYGDVFDVFAGEAVPAGPVAHWLGLLCATFGEFSKARYWLERARLQNERIGARLFIQYGVLAEARLLMREGVHLRRAEQLIDEVIVFGEQCGVLWLKMCAERLRASGTTALGCPNEYDPVLH